MAETVADTGPPGGGHLGRFEEFFEQTDASETDRRRRNIVDGQCPARKSQHLVKRVAGIGLTEQFQPRLFMFDRVAVVLAEDGAEVGVGGRHAHHLVLDVLLGDGQREIGTETIFHAVAGGGEQKVAAELLAGEIEEGTGGQQQRRSDARDGSRLDQPDQRRVSLRGRFHASASR